MKITFPELFKWQKDVWDFFNPRGKTIVIKALRQIGKSALCCLLLVQTALQIKGSTSIMIEPTLNQSRKAYNDIIKMLHGSGIIEKANESLLHIRFINGSEILFKSAEQGKNLRGYTVSGILVLDECAYLPDDFIEDVLPTRNFHKATIVAVSTPYFQSGWFYEHYILQDSDTKKSFDWSKYDTSEVLTPEQVEYYKKTYSKNKFTTDILGEFLVNDGNIFSNIEACIEDKPLFEHSNLYFGIDWGSGLGKDYTAICCLNESSEMIFIKHVNDKSPTEQVDYIAKLIEEYKPIKVTVESNSIGEVYYDLLQKKTNVKINRFATSNKSKNRIIDKLGVALENQKIKLIRDEELLKELRAYQMETTKSGLITYNGASGFNDDCVIATAICYDSIFSNKGSYQISIM